MSTLRAFRALCKVAAAAMQPARSTVSEFPNMAPGPWSNKSVAQQTAEVNRQPTPAPRRPPVQRPGAEVDAKLREIDNDPTIKPEDKEAEKQAYVDQWNQVNFR